MHTPKINESFECQNCHHQNPPAEKTCRNHCRKCLFSLHVDLDLPGDRKAECGGLMKPIDIEVKGGQMRSIIFQCKQCGKKGKNKILEDDNKDALMKVFTKANEDPQKRKICETPTF